MTDKLDRILAVVQEDVGKRGLRNDPQRNLITETAGDFRAACRSVAAHPAPHVAIVTGFFIPTAEPPAAETDGPLGAVFLVRAFARLGIGVTVLTDELCWPAFDSFAIDFDRGGPFAWATLKSSSKAVAMGPAAFCRLYLDLVGIDDKGCRITHLLAIERAGPNYADRCCTMRGLDITEQTSPAHWLFESAAQHGVTTMGIGDGGNEIGMGKIDRAVIARNIPRGDQIACRVPVDHLIVAGVSNWGAYALAAGVYHLRGAAPPAGLFDAAEERRILEYMVKKGPLVDGVLGKPSATVDGLSWAEYSQPLGRIQEILNEPHT